MGFLDTIKNRFGSSGIKIKQEDLNAYLKASRDNLKLAHENIGRFLESMRDFQPARRHEPLYHEQVKEKLIGMRAGMHKGLIFFDERMNNTINTMNLIKTPDQLKGLMNEWIKNIQAGDDKVYDILKILKVEMWDEEKIKRGFPVPMNKDMVCSYLVNAVTYLNQAKGSLDNYIAYSSMNNTV